MECDVGSSVRAHLSTHTNHTQTFFSMTINKARAELLLWKKQKEMSFQFPRSAIDMHHGAHTHCASITSPTVTTNNLRADQGAVFVANSLGTVLGAANTFNFVGDGVTATVGSISIASAGSVLIQEAGVDVTNATTITISGSTFSIADSTLTVIVPSVGLAAVLAVGASAGDRSLTNMSRIDFASDELLIDTTGNAATVTAAQIHQIAIGGGAYTNRWSVAVGTGAKSRGGYSVAIGHDAYVKTTSLAGLAIGTGAYASGLRATAIGSTTSGGTAGRTVASGRQSIAIGFGSASFNGPEASGDYSLAFNLDGVASGDHSMVLSDQRDASDSGSIAMGSSNVSHADVVAVHQMSSPANHVALCTFPTLWYYRRFTGQTSTLVLLNTAIEDDTSVLYDIYVTERVTSGGVDDNLSRSYIYLHYNQRRDGTTGNVIAGQALSNSDPGWTSGAATIGIAAFSSNSQLQIQVTAVPNAHPRDWCIVVLQHVYSTTIY